MLEEDKSKDVAYILFFLLCLYMTMQLTLAHACINSNYILLYLTRILTYPNLFSYLKKLHILYTLKSDLEILCKKILLFYKNTDEKFTVKIILLKGIS